jgi:hypothetical protein
MSTFIEVHSVEKAVSVIINLDAVIEIAPWREGGTVLFLQDATVAGGRVAYRVTDTYEQFKQFAMETVTAEDIARRFPKKQLLNESAPVNDIFQGEKSLPTDETPNEVAPAKEKVTKVEKIPKFGK